MPRKNLLRTDRLPYHVTTRTHNQEFFQIPLTIVWEMVQESLKEAYQVYKIELIAFVLMGNHYHMLLMTPEANIDLFMYEFNKRLAMKIKKQTNQVNNIFGSRYKWSLIRSRSYYMNCYRYIYQNPIRANLVSKSEEYPFSTLYFITKNLHFVIPIHDQFGFKDKYTLDWLNQKIADDEVVKIKKDMKRYLEPIKRKKVPGTF
jgi:putative transposase